MVEANVIVVIVAVVAVVEARAKRIVMKTLKFEKWRSKTMEATTRALWMQCHDQSR